MRFKFAFGLFLTVLLSAALPARGASAITASPASPWPAQSVAVAGTSFAASDTIDISLDGAAVQSATAGADGAFGTSLTIPLATAPGPHTITAVGRLEPDTAQATTTVTTSTRQFGFGPAHLGFNPYETVLSTANVRGLKRVWATTVSSNIEAGSTAAVVGPSVYVGTLHGVQALNRETGKVLWRAMTNEGSSGTPLVLGRVYAASERGTVQALDHVTGTTVWSRSLSRGFYGSPAGAGGVIYIGDVDGNVYALQASTGLVLWTFNIGGFVHGTPAIADGTVYVGSDNGNLYALNTDTGALIWSFASHGAIQGSPAVANGVVYVGSNDLNLYALRASNGDVLWMYKTGNFVFQTPAVAHGTIYIGAYDADFNPFFRALDASSGAVRWSVPVPSVTGSAAVANGVVYFTARQGRFFALDTSSGRLLYSAMTGSTYVGAPAVSDGAVYVNSFYPNGTVTALALKTEATRTTGR